MFSRIGLRGAIATGRSVAQEASGNAVVFDQAVHAGPKLHLVKERQRFGEEVRKNGATLQAGLMMRDIDTREKLGSPDPKVQQKAIGRLQEVYRTGSAPEQSWALRLLRNAV